MLANLTVALASDDDGLLGIVPLKQADDSEVIGHPISDESALDKLVRIREDGYDFWIARLNGEAVGYAMGGGKGDNYTSEWVYVTSAHRRHGVGSALVGAQIEFARKQGLTEILSDVPSANEGGRGMTEKLGFRLEPYESGYYARLSLKQQAAFS